MSRLIVLAAFCFALLSLATYAEAGMFAAQKGDPVQKAGPVQKGSPCGPVRCGRVRAPRACAPKACTTCGPVQKGVVQKGVMQKTIVQKGSVQKGPVQKGGDCAPRCCTVICVRRAPACPPPVKAPSCRRVRCGGCCGAPVQKGVVQKGVVQK